MRFRKTKDGYVVTTSLRGRDLLREPLANKGSAFTLEERQALDLRGMLPPAVVSMDRQVERAYEAMRRKHDDLEKYIGLAALQDRNEALFFRLLSEHIEEIMPIVYTPTVGEACQRYSRILRRARGVWVTADDVGDVDSVLRAAVPYENDVRLIVVTDNERILGLGDQGAGGIGIPIGKLALYSVAAGIHPAATLPVSLDVGTDNQELLDDPLYVGVRKPRLRGKAYRDVVDAFVQGVKRVFPDALLQWEDFKKQNAFDLLDDYREVLPSFNDDIEGTAAVALAGVIAASRLQNIPLKDQRIVILGAGAAGIGIARQLRDAMKREGVSGDDVHRAIAILDSQGLLVEGREFRDRYKEEFAWPAALAEKLGYASGSAKLVDIVRTLKPTALIGTSGQPGVFDQEVIAAMSEHVERPAVFPFSNPTSQSEAHPKDLLAWTGGRAVIATGSPFGTVEHDGKRIRIGQGNNVYIFPGVGLGALLSKARIVTDAMFTVAAHTLAESLDDDDRAAGSLFPKLTRLRAVSAAIAAKVAKEAVDSGVSRLGEKDVDWPARVEEAMWEPGYARVERPSS